MSTSKEAVAQARRDTPSGPIGVDRTLSALERISGALTATTDGVEALLQTLVRTVAEVFDCPFVFIVVRDGERERYAMYPSDDASGGRPFPGAWCITEQTLLAGGPMQVSCLIREGCPCEFPRDLVTVPMSREGLLAGSISLQTSGDRVLDEHNSTLLQVLANQAAVAVQNAKLLAETRELYRQADDLYRLAERKRHELEIARDEIAVMAREQIISDERERIARDLHDDVAQILAGIGLNVEWCRQQLPADETDPVQERLTCLKQLARDGLYEIRHTLLRLAPASVATLGLTRALEKLVSDFEHISRIRARLELTGPEREPATTVSTAIYHICQEALYNAFKHADADQVCVTFGYQDDDVVLSVTDDGIGIPADGGPTDARVTFGLQNMRARAEELGGLLRIERTGDHGTRVTARVPAS